MSKNKIKNISLFYLFFVYFYQIDIIPVMFEMKFQEIFNESILFLIPVIYVVYHAMKDEDKIPIFIKKISLVTLTILFIYQTYNFLIHITDLIGISNSFRYSNLIPLIFAILLMLLLSKFTIKQKITLPIFQLIAGVLIILTVLILWVQLSSENIMFVFINDGVGSFYYLINFLPIIYFMFLEVEDGEFEYTFIRTLIISLLLLIIVYITCRLNIQNSEIIKIDNQNIPLFTRIILIINSSVNYLTILFTYNFVIRKVNFVLKMENKKKPKYPIIIAILIVLYISSKVDAMTLLALVTVVIHLILGLIIVMYGFFIGMKKYNKSIQRLFLFLLPSFVILYVIYLFSFIHDIYGQTIFFVENLNYIFLIFSIFVITYYTFETLLLFYAYDKQKFSDSEPQIVIEKKYHIYVMIPCLNEEVVIRNTISSILTSDYENLSIYAIDDASTDKTAEIIDSFVDTRVKLIKRIKPNAQKGKGEALNYVFEMIKHDVNSKKIPFEDVLIAIIDADTFIPSDYFHKINYVFNANLDVTGLQSKVRVLSKTNDRSQDLEFTEIINATQALRMITNTVAFGGNGQFCKLFTLDSLKEKPWSESLVEDFDLSTRLFLAENVKSVNIQYSDIYIEQTGIDKDLKSLVKQRVRWAQGNVQSSKYIIPIIKSKKLEARQKFELLMTLIKPWLMAIEYVIVVYTVVAIIDGILLFGITHEIKNIVILFALMTLYILSINLIWAILYNRNKANQEKKVKKIINDWFYLTLFLLSLTQIYPQSLIRYFKSENGWDKTKRQK